LSITHPDLINKELKYCIYDATGKKLQSGLLRDSDQKVVDVSSLPGGIYVINVSNGKFTYSNKFIKSGD
jgi:hypothetical protein